MGRGGERYGAGRPGWRRKCEQLLPLDIRRIHRKGLLHPSSSFGWHWNIDGEPCGNIRIAVGVASLQLGYSCVPQEERINLRYDVQIQRTSCNYGGTRPWFLCPRCSRRCAMLYGVSRQDGYFGCRRCLRLAYTSEAEDLTARLWRKQRKLEARLNWLGGDVPDRPKGMRFKTFERLLVRIDSIEEAKDVAFVSQMAQRYIGCGMTPEELLKKLG